MCVVLNVHQAFLPDDRFVVVFSTGKNARCTYKKTSDAKIHRMFLNFIIIPYKLTICTLSNWNVVVFDELSPIYLNNT